MRRLSIRRGLLISAVVERRNSDRRSQMTNNKIMAVCRKINLLLVATNSYDDVVYLDDTEYNIFDASIF